MYFAIQQCWNDSEQYHPLYTGALLVLSNSVLCFTFAAICHMLWWHWFTTRQREASAYAFLVAIVFNATLGLKYFFPSTRPHPECSSCVEVLFGGIKSPWPSTHVAVAVFMGLFYLNQTWRDMFPSQGDDDEDDDPLEGDVEDPAPLEDDGIQGLNHINLKDLLAKRKRNALRGEGMEDEVMGKLEGFSRIGCIGLYVWGVALARLHLELNHVEDVIAGAFLAVVLYLVFCLVYTGLANRLTARLQVVGEKME